MDSVQPGVISAVRQYSFLDFVSTILAHVFAAVPQVLAGNDVCYAVFKQLGLLPSTLQEWFTMKPFFIMLCGDPWPWLTAASILRLTCSNMLETHPPGTLRDSIWQRGQGTYCYLQAH